MKNEKGEIVYHYCSLEGFLNIIQNASLWMSDILYYLIKEQFRRSPAIYSREQRAERPCLRGYLATAVRVKCRGI